MKSISMTNKLNQHFWITGVLVKKISVLIIMLIATSVVNATTYCSSVENGEGSLLTLKKKELKLKNVKINDVLLFGNNKVKILDFYGTGGPEEGLTVEFVNGVKVDIWCSDENTPTDN